MTDFSTYLNLNDRLTAENIALQKALLAEQAAFVEQCKAKWNALRTSMTGSTALRSCGRSLRQSKAHRDALVKDHDDMLSTIKTISEMTDFQLNRMES